MPRETLTAANLGELAGGESRAVIDAALRAAVQDTEDRGEDGKPRKVNITLTMLKKKSGVVEVGVECKTTIPTYRTSETLARVKIAGVNKFELEFQPLSPDHPDQNALPFEKDGDE